MNKLLSTTIFVVAMVSIVAITIVPIALAQNMSGDITAPSGENPFGGENMGTVSVNSDGNMTNVTADLNQLTWRRKRL